MIEPEAPSGRAGRATSLPGMPLYAATIFLSAFLLFLVQPIIAKAILPWFGGTAAVWTICLLFFQVALLLGYLYAHWSVQFLSPRQQALCHVVLLAGSVLLLPITPRSSWKPHGGGDPTLAILLLLLFTIGLPYFLLSTTGPLLQAWYTRHTQSDHALAPDAPGEPPAFPYRLYALSNLGSLLALAGYPIGVEPHLTLRQQSLGWSAGYVCFVLLCAAVALRVRRLPPSTTPRSEAVPREAPRPSWGLHLWWLVLAACPSIMLLAVTNHLSQNVAAIPFLWVLPLGLYLLSFIVCFGGKGWRWEKAFLPLPALAIGAMAYALSPDVEVPGLGTLIAVFSCGLFICCVVCHGELARLKPHPHYLTSFYLMLSIGGAVGGLFVGLLAPHLFRDYYELPIAVAACALIALFVLYRDEASGWWSPSWITLGGLTLALIWFIAHGVRQWHHDYRLTVRNFYGVLRVNESGDGSSDAATRSLTHGTTLHGEQYLKPALHMRPTTYYGPDSGVGLAVRAGQSRWPERVGVIGLGTGTMAAYGRIGDRYQFYDINPLVVRLAHTQFSFLKDCKAHLGIVLGDARLSLEREPKQNFDVLVVDAFSSDAIPVHLLTREAFLLYFRHLKPGGVLAVHVSNRYLELQPVVQAIAASLGKATMLVANEDDAANHITASEWVLVTGRRSFFNSPLLKKACQPVKTRKDLRMWTDDYSNLFQILKARHAS